MKAPLYLRMKWARAYLAKVDGAVSGQEGSRRTFAVCCTLLRDRDNETDRAGFSLTPADALKVIQDWNRKCIPPWTEPEIIHKLNDAAKAVGREAADFKHHVVARRGRPEPALERTREKLEFEPEFLQSVADRFPKQVEIYRFLSDRSVLPPDRIDSDSFLRNLYRPGEKVVVFTVFESQGQFVWSYDEQVHLPSGGPDGVWYLCQPVDGMWHPNPRQNLKLSRRSEESVLDWRYFVIESDKAEKEPWLRALVQLPLRIAAIYDSGGKSIHALCRIDAPNKPEWDIRIDAIKPSLIRLGADRSCLTAVRLTRLPGCRRGEKGQKLLYLNSEPTFRPIGR